MNTQSRQTSQKVKILNLLEANQSITPILALNKFGVFRLSAIIRKLRVEGHDIKTTMVRNPRNNSLFASYKLV